MRKRTFTIMVLESSAGPVRTVHVCRGMLTGIVVLAVVAALGIAWLVSECGRMREQVAAERGDPLLEVDWRGLRGLVARAERRMAAVRDLDRALRVAVGTASDEADVAMTAQGGGDPEHHAALEVVMQGTNEQVAWGGGEISTLDAEIELIERGLRRLQTFFDDRHAALAAAPTILPVPGWLAARYGNRTSPFTGKREFHEGIDIAAAVGTPIRATAAGTVRFAGAMGSYGNVIVIDHAGGIRTLYAHNSRHRVRAGQRVERGDVIGTVGATGRTTGAHVHYEVQVRGASADPLRFAIDTSGVLIADLPAARKSRGDSGLPDSLPPSLSRLLGTSTAAPGAS